MRRKYILLRMRQYKKISFKKSKFRGVNWTHTIKGGKKSPSLLQFSESWDLGFAFLVADYHRIRLYSEPYFQYKMYIKSVTIDGFKSYAQRTEISGFDYLFNAITGLNGSGKSNILDAICFLLGISNLSQVCYALLLFCLYLKGIVGTIRFNL